MFTIDVTVDVGYMPTSIYGPSMPSSVANLHAMHVQGLVIQRGFAAVIGGIIAIGLGSIEELMQRPRRGVEEPATTGLANNEPWEGDLDEPTQEEKQSQFVAFGVAVGILLLLGFIAYMSGAGLSRNYNDAVTANESVNEALEALNELDNAARALEQADEPFRR